MQYENVRKTLFPQKNILIKILGNAAGWYALSGYTYVNNTDGGIRFMEEPFGCNDTSIPGN